MYSSVCTACNFIYKLIIVLYSMITSHVSSLLLPAAEANEEEMNFGSLCGGGRYDDLVASFDPKGQFKVFEAVC